MIEPARESDYKKLLKFETAVFHTPFLVIMPKLYKDRLKCVNYHRIIKENNKIIAAYAVYNTGFITSQYTLKAVGIGSVAVSKSQRSKGIMSHMIQSINNAAQKDNIDIAFLSGYRQRYERFGYVPCGEKYIYDITDNYINHCGGSTFSFTPLNKCRSYIKNAVSQFNAQNMHWLRKEEEFEDIVSTWHSKCFVIFDQRKNYVGYLIANYNLKSITEILCKSSELSDILVSFAKKFSKKNISVIFQPWQKELIKEIDSFGEHFKVQSSASFKFFGFERIIRAMMNEKLEENKLCEGSLKLELGDEKICVTVKDRICTVENTPFNEPDIKLSYTDAMKALTTHFSDIDNTLFRAWSPMCPISISHVDMV